MEPVGRGKGKGVEMRIGLKKKIVAAGLFPILLLGFLTIIITLTMVKGALVQEVEESLRGTAYATLAAYEQNSGIYLQSANGDVWKGSYNISKSENLVDSIKKNSGMDVTFFYGDKRVMSSVIDENGVRALGSPAGEKIVQKVLQNGEEYFSGGVSLNGKLNYGYYVPIYQKAGEPPVGMVFAGTDKAQKDQAVNRIVYTVVIAAAVVMAFCILFMIVFSQSLTTSLHKSVQLVQSVAKGDLGVEPDKKLLARKDEIGDLSKALGSLRNELRNILGRISDNIELIQGSSEGLEKMATETVETMRSVEGAVMDIARGADEQARNSVRTSENVQEMGERIAETASEVAVLNKNAADMQNASDKTAETMRRLHEINEEVHASIEQITMQTNETNEAAKQIKKVTELITEIAEETTLLSLNASIEAACAGEHGRGFAVVASQIQKLAEQTNASSQSIEKIIMILMENSDEAVTAMQHVQEIIGSQSESLKDTEAIVAEVSKGIGKSMQGIRQIDGSTKLLQDEREEIIETVKGLTEIAERNAVNTEKTSTITNEVTGNFEMVEESAQQLKEIAGQLEECVRYFQL